MSDLLLVFVFRLCRCGGGRRDLASDSAVLLIREIEGESNEGSTDPRITWITVYRDNEPLKSSNWLCRPVLSYTLLCRGSHRGQAAYVKITGVIEHHIDS